MQWEKLKCVKIWTRSLAAGLKRVQLWRTQFFLGSWLSAKTLFINSLVMRSMTNSQRPLCLFWYMAFEPLSLTGAGPGAKLNVQCSCMSLASPPFLKTGLEDVLDWRGSTSSRRGFLTPFFSQNCPSPLGEIVQLSMEEGKNAVSDMIFIGKIDPSGERIKQSFIFPPPGLSS